MEQKNKIRRQIQNISLSGKNTWEIAAEAFNLGVQMSADNSTLNHEYFDRYDGDYDKYQEYKDFWPNRSDWDGDSYGVDVYSVDKQSILKLLIK